ncbi:hypothetical protein [Thiocapsa sp.]|nr:hypothetical protein [Thiocapsa sp.]HSO82786.1 hypothetical protein [Thiocapsa sp.]
MRNGKHDPAPRNLLRGKIHLFSLNTLVRVNMAASAAMHIELHLRHAA